MKSKNNIRNIFLNPSSEQKEKSFFDSFIALESNLPVGNWDKSESPDYLLVKKNIVIGLEITTLTEPKSKRQYEMTAIRTAQDKAISMAKELAIKNDLSPLEVKVKYKNDRAGIDISLASKELYKIVEKYSQEIDNSKLWWKYIKSSRVFSEFSIRLGTSNGRMWLQEHRWSRLHRNWVGMDPIPEIQSCIYKKHLKLKSYLKKCDKCWLLIGVDEWTAPEAFELTEKSLKHLFESKFDRVYFLRNIERKLYRLKKKIR
jgi:CRISPR/Cas system CSM-associated protein Csm2 small subunit